MSKRRFTKEEFIAKAREKHGDKYSYDRVEYINDITPVVIICPIHGDFSMTPNNHKAGHGCPTCARERIKALLMDSKEGFITKARMIHGDYYIYDKVIYKGNNKKVTIICPKHVEFQMTPHKHKARQGCSKCDQSHLETETRALLEQNNITYESQMKFTWLMSSKNYPMKLDFYLPQYNIAIECHGIQLYFIKYNENIKERIDSILNGLKHKIIA